MNQIPNQLFSFSSDKDRRTDSRIRRKNTAQPRRESNLRCVFSSDPAVSSSIFVGAEREENLIRNDPNKSEFTNQIPLVHNSLAQQRRSLGHRSNFLCSWPTFYLALFLSGHHQSMGAMQLCHHHDRRVAKNRKLGFRGHVRSTKVSVDWERRCFALVVSSFDKCSLLSLVLFIGNLCLPVVLYSFERR